MRNIFFFITVSFYSYAMVAFGRSLYLKKFSVTDQFFRQVRKTKIHHHLFKKMFNILLQ